MERRRNYKQFCGLARALDHVGERWTLLVVRNLLLGPKRYTDLIEGLPGITTNLLARRLRELERMGLILKRKASAPVRATVYELSPMGRALEPALMELARWGGRFMAQPGRDTMNVSWGLLSLKRRYRGGLELVVELDVAGRQFELAFSPRYLAVTEARAARPNLTVKGSLAALRSWLFQGADADALRAQGELVVTGAEAAWRALGSAFEPREKSAEDLAERYSALG